MRFRSKSPFAFIIVIVVFIAVGYFFFSNYEKPYKTFSTEISGNYAEYEFTLDSSASTYMRGNVPVRHLWNEKAAFIALPASGDIERNIPFLNSNVISTWAKSRFIGRSNPAIT